MADEQNEQPTGKEPPVKLREISVVHPVAGLREGVHYANLFSAVPKDDAVRILEDIGSLGFSDVLGKYGIGRVEVHSRIPGNPGLLGGYRKADRRLRIAFERGPGTYGQTFIPGESASMSITGATVAEARKLTLTQELAHHLQNAADNSGLRQTGEQLSAAPGDESPIRPSLRMQASIPKNTSQNASLRTSTMQRLCNPSTRQGIRWWKK